MESGDINLFDRKNCQTDGVIRDSEYTLHSGGHLDTVLRLVQTRRSVARGGVGGGRARKWGPCFVLWIQSICPSSMTKKIVIISNR